jgi:hypothetical protein
VRLAVLAGQRGAEAAPRLALWPPGPAALDVTDRSHAHARPLSQLLLRQARGTAQRTELTPETTVVVSNIGHYPQSLKLHLQTQGKRPVSAAPASSQLPIILPVKLH